MALNLMLANNPWIHVPLKLSMVPELGNEYHEGVAFDSQQKLARLQQESSANHTLGSLGLGLATVGVQEDVHLLKNCSNLDYELKVVEENFVSYFCTDLGMA